MRLKLFALGALLALSVPLWITFQKETTLAEGRTIRLELAPVDPRSLIQGDYMRLRYKMPAELERVLRESRGSGVVVVSVDEAGTATPVRPHDGGPLSSGEALLKYKYRDGRVQLGAPSFFFQEGEQPRYTGARYGVLKVDQGGNSVLFGLAGEDLELLGTTADINP